MQKTAELDKASKDSEKAFFAGGGDIKSILDGYLAQRREFHKYSILKVKVPKVNWSVKLSDWTKFDP